MKINHYYHYENEQVSFTRNQASSFAKGIAGDFNPIHDEDARRFCVPGDLLFAVFLAQYGISQEMKIEFAGMVVDTTRLLFPETISDSHSLVGDNEKNYLDVVCSGEKTMDEQFITSLVEKYVQFSGQTFPHILVPLMQRENVMINPARPLVIYKNMEIHLDKLTGKNITLALSDSILQSSGKKGEVRLEFTILADGDVIGHGAKNMLLSGLRDYDQNQLDEVIHSYAQRKSSYLA